MKIYKALLLSLILVSTITKPMNEDLENIQVIELSPVQQQIQSLLQQKRIRDALYTTFVLSTATATLCNTIWEEPTLHSDYSGANVLSVYNKINTTVTMGLALADILWLFKPYCEFSPDATQEYDWPIGMFFTHSISGGMRGVVAGAVGVFGGIRRYPRTLATLGANILLDCAGLLNAANHLDTIEKIEKLQK